MELMGLMYILWRMGNEFTTEWHTCADMISNSYVIFQSFNLQRLWEVASGPHTRIFRGWCLNLAEIGGSISQSAGMGARHFEICSEVPSLIIIRSEHFLPQGLSCFETL